MLKPTLLDDFQAIAPEDPTRVGAFSSWPKLAVAASEQRSGVVSTGCRGGFRHDLLESLPRCHQAFVAGRKGQDNGFRSDELTALLARAFLHEAKPNFLFISLGESDENAHRGDYLGYLRSVRAADAFVGLLRSDLKSRANEGVETLLLVTTDHGRAHNFNDHGRKNPESSRGFLFAEGKKVRPVGRVEGGRAYLKDIAPTVRAVSGLRARHCRESGRVLKELLV